MAIPHSFLGCVSVSGGNTITGDQTFSDDVACEGTLDVTGAATLASTLAVDGAVTMASSLTVTGDVVITGNLTHTGGAIFAEVRAATTANITLSGAQTIDGVSVVAGNRVLVKNQSTASQNGIYVAASGAWARSVDLPAGASAAGVTVMVQEGTVSADVIYICTDNVGSDVVGTNNLTFASGAVLDALLVHKAGVENITGVKTFTAGLALSTAQTLVAGSNTLVGTVADKLNPVHLAIASQAIGDLLVADSTTTMARLPDVATGQVLKSGGVGAAPAYGAIGGTTAAGSAHTHAFTGTAATTATAEAFTGTGYSTAGQVVTTSDNQTMTLNQCAGMWLITATQAPCLIASNTAVTGAPAVLTVFGLAPTTTAEDYKILIAPTPAGTNANESAHTHSGTGLT